MHTKYWRRFLVWWNCPAPQTSTGEILHDGHAHVHDRAHTEEHVVEGTDGQVSSFISIFQGDDGTVRGIGEVTEPWVARLNNLHGALQRATGGAEWEVRFPLRTDGMDLLWRCRRAFVRTSQRRRSPKGDTCSWSNAAFQGRSRDTLFASHPASSSPQTLCAPDPARSGTTCGETDHTETEQDRWAISAIHCGVFTSGWVRVVAAVLTWH